MQQEFFTGVLVTSLVINDRTNYKKEAVLEDIASTINLSLYTVVEEKDRYLLNIDQEIFCNNIAYFLAEQYKIMNITEAKYSRELKNIINILRVNEFQNYLTYSKTDENCLFRYISQSRGFAIVRNANFADSVTLEGFMYVPSPKITFIESYAPFVDAMTTLIHRSTANPLAKGVIFCNFYDCYMM